MSAISFYRYLSLPTLVGFFPEFGVNEKQFRFIADIYGKRVEKKVLFSRWCLCVFVEVVGQTRAHSHWFIGRMSLCITFGYNLIHAMEHSMHLVSKLCAHNSESIFYYLNSARERERAKERRKKASNSKYSLYDKWICWIVLLFFNFFL